MGSSTSKPEPKWFPEFEKNLPNLQDKTVAITGCTSGTGLVVAKTSAKKGAKNIVMLNRPSSRATAAETAVKEIADPKVTSVETIPCDLQDLSSVQAAADSIKKKYTEIDVLCNNAGVMALDDYATKDGFDVQMQTNHLSHFKLTNELFPLLKAAAAKRGQARIVNHSSGARHRGEPLAARYFGKNGGNLGGNSSSMWTNGAKWERYHQTKLANSVYTAALTQYLQGTGVIAAVAAPGLSATSLQDTTSKTGGMDGAMWIMRFAQSAEDGAMPLLAACFDPSTQSGDFWEPSGMMNMSGPAIKVKYDKNTADVAQQKLLWEESEKAVGKSPISSK